MSPIRNVLKIGSLEGEPASTPVDGVVTEEFAPSRSTTRRSQRSALAKSERPPPWPILGRPARARKPPDHIESVTHGTARLMRDSDGTRAGSLTHASGDGP